MSAKTEALFHEQQSRKKTEDANGCWDAKHDGFETVQGPSKMEQVA